MRLRAIVRTGFALTIVLSCLGGYAASASAATSSPIAGYWGTDSTGTVGSDGDAPDLGDLHGVHLNAPIVGIAATPTGKGYWLAGADGGVFTFGDAHFYGSAGAIHLNMPVVGIAATPSGHGYWLVASDGGVFTYGDARFYGSAGNVRLNAPIVGIARTHLGRGYLLAASDGGVFTYGDAHFYGSAGNLQLNAPVVGIATTGDHGYRLAARDGGVFTYGGARFSGAATGYGPIAAIATSPFGGYVLQPSVGGLLGSFGNASSCLHEAVGPGSPTRPRFVGVALAFDPAGPLVGDGALATAQCPIMWGHTGRFRAPARWHVDAYVDPKRSSSCNARVELIDPGGTTWGPSHNFPMSGSIQMRKTQMAGRSVFNVYAGGFNCPVVVTDSFVSVQSLPFTTTAPGDTRPFSAAGPITITANGDCTTEVRADDDGRLIQRDDGSSYTMNVPAGSYWLSNSTGCTVSVS